MVRRAKGFSFVSEDSILKKDIPPTRRYGMMNNPKTTMPTPPSQHMSDRHIRTPGGASSSPTITVDPVVVIAETDSKSACAKSRSRDDIHSGKAPINAKVDQSTLTSKKPNFLENGGGPARVAMKVVAESPLVTKAAVAKTCQSVWP